MPTFPPLCPSLSAKEGIQRNRNSRFSFVINSLLLTFLPPSSRQCCAPSAVRRRTVPAKCSDTKRLESFICRPGELRQHSRWGRYPRTPTAASCSAVVASTSSSALRSLARRGTLFVPARRSIERANVPAGTTCILGLRRHRTAAFGLVIGVELASVRRRAFGQRHRQTLRSAAELHDPFVGAPPVQRHVAGTGRILLTPRHPWLRRRPSPPVRHFP